MSRLYLVRHGRAAAGWNVDPDPPLDDHGRAQALAVAQRLSGLETRTVLSSPLLRCQQTAFPLATSWGVEVNIEPGVAEIPSPAEFTVESRGEWLRDVMAGTWTQAAEKSGEQYSRYRHAVADTLRALAGDAVVFSHYIAINAAIGVATGDDRVVVAQLDNCSVTVIDVHPSGRLEVVEIGGEADTIVR